MMAFDVFISYPNQDKAVADAVCAKLEGDGIRCWIAPRDIAPSADWAASIIEAIEHCRVMVLIFSSHSNRSKQVHREVQQAFDGEKAVLPFRIESVPPEKTLRYYMGAVHWLDALTPPLENHLQLLSTAIRSLVGAQASVKDGQLKETGPQVERLQADSDQRLRPATHDSAEEMQPKDGGKAEAEAEKSDRKEEEAQRSLQREEDLARQRAKGERHAEDAEAKRRADQEWVLAAAKRADTVKAIEEFLSDYPESHLRDEATALHAVLIARDKAYEEAMGSDNAAVLRAFLRDYPTGKLAEQVRRRMWTLEPAPESKPISRRTYIVAGCVTAAAGLGTLAAMRKDLSAWATTVSPTLTFMHGDRVASVAVAPDGKTALSGGANTIKIWDLTSGSSIRTLVGHNGQINSIRVLPGGMAVSASEDRTLKLWDLKNAATIRTFTGHADFVTSVAILPDGRSILSASGDKTLRLWDLASGNTIRVFKSHTDQVRCVAVTPNGRVAISGSMDKTLRWWDLASGSVIHTNSGRSGIWSVAIAPDGKTVASGSETVTLWETEGGNKIRDLASGLSPDSIVFGPDGRTLLIGNFSWEHTARLCDVESGRLLGKFIGHAGYVRSVAFAPDGLSALSGSHDGTVKLWKIDENWLRFGSFI